MNNKTIAQQFRNRLDIKSDVLQSLQLANSKLFTGAGIKGDSIVIPAALSGKEPTRLTVLPSNPSSDYLSQSVKLKNFERLQLTSTVRSTAQKCFDLVQTFINVDGLIINK